MKRSVAVWIGSAVLTLGALGLHQGLLAHQSTQAEAAAGDAIEDLKLETLLSEALEGVDGTEVIVSRVTMPPNRELPRHWHPGEEFAYVLEGAAILWQEGKEDVPVKAGEVVKIPLKQVHTAITGDEGATFLVFRVHESGEPERVLVE